MRRKWVTGTFKMVAWVLVTCAVILLICNWWVVSSTQQKILSDYKELPDSSVVLVLGTSSKLLSGAPNPFFEDRISAASQLYKLGKAKMFLLSGDNRTKYYNEPIEMRKALVKLGVPESIIKLDFAGLRTLDSVVRCKEIFGQNKIIIVTQPFHSYRAIFISDYYEVDAVAWDANSEIKGSTTKVQMREVFARAKAVLDLFVLKTTPRHLGEKENLTI